MKEVRTKLDIYIPLKPEDNEEQSKEKVYNRIASVLSKLGVEYQIYEQEIKEV